MKKNYLYNLALTVFNILFPILSFPYASRILGPVGIGKFQFITSFAQYFILIANLGVPTYGAREIAKHKNEPDQQSKIFSELMIISFAMSLVLTLVYFTVIFCLNYFHADQQLYLVAGVSVFLGFTSIDWLYTGLEQFRMIAIRSVAVKVLSLILLYVFVKDAHDLITYLYIAIFSSVANNAYNLISAGRNVTFKWSSLEFKHHFKPLVLILGLYIATSMYTLLDVVLLGFLSNPKAVGLYSAAVKLTKIVLPFITSVGTVTMPKMALEFANRNFNALQVLLNKSLHFILFFSIPSFAGLALLAPQFILVFSGRKFLDGALSMQILSLLPVFIGLGYFWGVQILISAGKDKEMVYAVIGGMIVAITLNLILVPRLQEVGASAANTITELVVTLLYVYFVKKHFSFSFKWGTAWRAVLATLPFIPIVYLSKRWPVSQVWHLVIPVLLCGFSYLFIQGVVFKDYLIKEFFHVLQMKLGYKRVNENL